MKIPALLLTSLLSASAIAQTTKPLKTNKKNTKKPNKVNSKAPIQQKKDSIITAKYCPPCGMG